jgi:hypothetical protein
MKLWGRSPEELSNKILIVNKTGRKVQIESGLEKNVPEFLLERSKF